MRSHRGDMAIRSLPWTSAVVCLAFLLTAAEFIVSVQANCKYFDFENGMKTLSKWTKTGHAFDNQPTFRDNANERDPSVKTNVQGDWWIGTFENRSSPTAEAGYMEGDYPIGTLTSPEFRIKGSNMDFLLGGGCDGENIRAELLVNGKVQRVAYADYCRERMRRRLWNVAEFRNQIGQIRLVDGSRKGHINFDDLRGDFTCLGSEFNPLTSKNAATDNEVVVVDEPSDSANQSKSEEKPGDDPITGTEEDYSTVENSSKQGTITKGIKSKRIHNFSLPPMQDEPVKMGKGIALERIRNFSLPQMQDGPVKIRKGMLQQQRLLGKAKTNGSLSITASPKPPRLSKTFSATAKISKPPVAKSAAKVPRRDSANNSLLPRDDDLRNLTCKNFLVEIKTGLPWDNDFLFVSNNNYQSTRRDIELKVLNVYEDDKDFRGAFFSKFSSSKEPEGVKAYFILRFRAADTFLGKLLDKLGDGKIAAAGCYEDVTQCPSNCPSTCVPLCLASCCQPVYQPVPAPMPAPPPQPVPAVMPSPQVYQPPVQQWNNQLPVQATRPPAPAASSQFPMSQAMSWPGSQCASGCSPNCEPSCSPTCCRFFNSKRTKTNIKSILKKKPLEEEKH